MLKLRLSMGGTKKRPVYKIVVADSKFPRDGRFIEKLGFFNPLLPKEKIDALPKDTGVYYFKDQNGKIIYVGKANNIRARVLSHFYDKAKKELKMCQQTADISFTQTGSELLALLYESAEIKKHMPLYNRAQRRTKDSFGLFTYMDQRGIKHLAYARINQIPRALITFPNQNACRAFLTKLCEKFELCPKYCHLQQTSGSCFHFQLKNCHGVCNDQESIVAYNIRVDQAIETIYQEPKTFIIEEKGRKSRLDGVPNTLPALIRAERLQQKASYAGFDWEKIEQVWEKVHEEILELKNAEISGVKQNIEEEIGDLIFAIVNLSRHLNIASEDALRKTNQKFVRRFKKVEEGIQAKGRELKEASLDEMDLIWNEAKHNE